MSDTAGRTNLLGMTRTELEAFVGGFGAKPYRARQLLKWVYRRGESDFARMTDLATDFRAELSRRATVAVPEIVATRIASDGTRKWLLRMPGAAGNEQVIETVFIPAHPELSEVSSSKLKDLAARGMDVSRYCPAEIVERLNRRAAAGALAKGEGAHV